MTEQSQSHFDGWAIVEVFGHQRYAGKVTTEAYGQAVMWRVDVPEIPEREKLVHYSTLTAKDGIAPAGSVVKYDEIPGYTKLFGTGAIYAVTPCTEEAARAAVLSMADRTPLKLVKLPEGNVEQPLISDIFHEDEDDEVPY